MEKRVFSYWIRTFKDSINGYDYYTDFELVFRKAKMYKVEINILNSLVGSSNIKQEFRDILANYPSIIKAIPILLAVRKTELFCQDEDGGTLYNFDISDDVELNEDAIKKYSTFMQKTGLFNLLEKHIIGNLYDYVLGVETGLDSHGRKNRGGHQMENLVESFIKQTGAEYYKEMYINNIEDKWNVDLSAISAEGTSNKRWDFVVKTKDTVYVIETNFYTAGGSKLNETARSYKMITEETKDIPNVEFIWITDGAGWNSASGNLEETFNSMEFLFNIQDMEDGVLKKLFGGN